MLAENLDQVKQIFYQLLFESIIEVCPHSDEHADSLVKYVNPLFVIPKDDKEMRPCLDCTRSGLNELTTPRAMLLHGI